MAPGRLNGPAGQSAPDARIMVRCPTFTLLPNAPRADDGRSRRRDPRSGRAPDAAGPRHPLRSHPRSGASGTLSPRAGGGRSAPLLLGRNRAAWPQPPLDRVHAQLRTRDHRVRLGRKLRGPPEGLPHAGGGRPAQPAHGARRPLGARAPGDILALRLPLPAGGPPRRAARGAPQDGARPRPSDRRGHRTAPGARAQPPRLLRGVDAGRLRPARREHRQPRTGGRLPESGPPARFGALPLLPARGGTRRRAARGRGGPPPGGKAGERAHGPRTAPAHRERLAPVGQPHRAPLPRPVAEEPPPLPAAGARRRRLPDSRGRPDLLSDRELLHERDRDAASRGRGRHDRRGGRAQGVRPQPGARPRGDRPHLAGEGPHARPLSARGCLPGASVWTRSSSSCCWIRPRA